MIYLSADCILPVSGKPCYNSVLALEDDGTVEGIYPASDFPVQHSEIHHYDGVLCPGFVNTHCHLELSWSKGLIVEGCGLDSFVQQLEYLKKSVTKESIQHSVASASAEMEYSGIVAVADISNGSETIRIKRNTNLYYHTFVEVFGSNPMYAEKIFGNASHLKKQFNEEVSENASITPHATYSLSDELFYLISANCKHNLVSIHHQENADENSFFKDGTGPIAVRRLRFNPQLPAYKANAQLPIENIIRFFDKEQKIVLVHNTVSELKDIELAEHYFSNVYWCLCPNANLYIENRLPQISLFRSMGCKITLGTDSLASNHQLSILEEIRTIQLYFNEIPLSELLEWGTLNGARFLGLEYKLGSFEKGKKPGVVHIDNIDIQTLKLSELSKSRLIIKA